MVPNDTEIYAVNKHFANANNIKKNNSEKKMFRQNLGLIRKLSLSQFRTSNLLITDSAASRLKEICSPAEYLRVSVGGGGCSGYSYEFDLSDEPIDPDMDLVFTKDGSRVGKIINQSLRNVNGDFSHR